MPDSLRQFTREQASDGTTIDGNRVERGLGDLLRRFNGFTNGGVGLGKRDKARRWFQSQWSGGYFGANGAGSAQRAAPWMFCFNGGSELVNWAAGNTPMNRFRNKGHRNDFIDPVLLPSTNSLRVWTHAFAHPRPIYITGLQLTLHVDGTYFTNTFLYGAGSFPASIQATPSQDICVELLVDDPFAPEDRRLANPEVHRQRFRADSVRISPLAIPAGYADFNPPDTRIPAGGRQGLHISLQGLQIPIPRDSRSRLSFVIPQYDNAVFPSGWGASSHRAQGYSWSLTMLEEAL